MKTLLTAFVLLAAAGAFAHKPVVEERENYICTARSLTGKRYSASGTDKAATQEAAMQKCEAKSFRCYRTGCSP